MIVNLLIACGGTLFLLLLWLAVQQLSRHFARSHPEWGPAREAGGGCSSSGGSCNSCSGRQHEH
ncbi:MAG: chemotaxis protein [Gammaproteobacteria bacterium]|nr:chemotaxis protein [Gammaproteobacteria bacterium]